MVHSFGWRCSCYRAVAVVPERRLLYLEENGMVLVRSLGKGQNSRVMRASIDSLLGGRWCF